MARSQAFVVLAAAMSLAAFAVYAVVVNLVPLLTGRGLTTSAAALALGLGGVGQVCGRLGYRRLEAVTSVRTRTAVVLLATAGATAVLGVLPGPAAALVAVAMLVGATRGVFTLLQATAVVDRWGAAHYGRLNGVLSAPVTLAAAIAPWAGSALAAWLDGYPAIFLVLATTGATAALLATTTAPPAAVTLNPAGSVHRFTLVYDHTQAKRRDQTRSVAFVGLGGGAARQTGKGRPG